MNNRHHAWTEGYQARIKNIPRQNNWYEPVRPGTKDALEWFAGWDEADGDLEWVDSKPISAGDEKWKDGII